MKRGLYPFVKWGARISIVAMTFLPALFYTAYRMGSVTDSPHIETVSERIYLVAMPHPFTAVFLKVAILGVSVLVSFIEVEIVHGRRSTDRICGCIRALATTPCLSFALLVFGAIFLADSSPFNGPLSALLAIPTLWFIGLLFIPDPEHEDS